MLANYKKKQKRHPLVDFLILCGGVVILAIIFFLLIANLRMYQRRERLLSQAESTKNKIQETQQKNDELKEIIAHQDESDYIEKIAREELNLQKPGETVVSFVVTENATKEEDKKENILQVWLGWVGGFFDNK